MIIPGPYFIDEKTEASWHKIKENNSQQEKLK